MFSTEGNESIFHAQTEILNIAHTISPTIRFRFQLSPFYSTIHTSDIRRVLMLSLADSRVRFLSAEPNGHFNNTVLNTAPTTFADHYVHRRSCFSGWATVPFHGAVRTSVLNDFRPRRTIFFGAKPLSVAYQAHFHTMLACQMH